MATKTKKELEAEIRKLHKEAKSKRTGKKPVKGPSVRPLRYGDGVALGVIGMALLIAAVLFGAWLIARALQPAAVSAGPAAPVAAPADPAVPPANPEATNCRDGEETGNMLNPLERTPVGDLKFATVQEVSVKGGAGFGGYYRWIQVSGPLGNDRQVFNVEITTIHELRYCGALEAVKSYVSRPETHIWAMRSTAADTAGNMPVEGEIPVVYVDPTSLSVTFLVSGNAAGAPSLEIIKNHLQVVDLQH